MTVDNVGLFYILICTRQAAKLLGSRLEKAVTQKHFELSHRSLQTSNCYRHFRFKSWYGPAIQVQTLNGLMETNSVGC